VDPRERESIFWRKDKSHVSGFGGLEVACSPLVPKFVGSHPAEAMGFLGRKNPQRAFLRRGSKAVGPRVVALRHVKDP
jgi:hypothetical protein